MEIYYSKHFQRQFKKLEIILKDKANMAISLFRENPFHPKLKTHKLHRDRENLWAFSVTYSYRIIFKFENEKIVHLYYIGDHDIYN